MAGRGRRIGYAERATPLRRPGVPYVPSGDNLVDIPILFQKINDISMSNLDPVLINDIETIFKQLCPTQKDLEKVLVQLHVSALADHIFGEKVVVAYEHLASLEIDGMVVRTEILKRLQYDYKEKGLMSQTDKGRFMNSVMLLGGVYAKLKLNGSPITILGSALFDYFELLLKGDEPQLRILTMQVG